MNARLAEICDRATRRASALLQHTEPRPIVLTEVQLVIEDVAFMAPLAGSAPQSIVDAIADEAVARLRNSSRGLL